MLVVSLLISNSITEKARLNLLRGKPTSPGCVSTLIVKSFQFESIQDKRIALTTRIGHQIATDIHFHALKTETTEVNSK